MSKWFIVSIGLLIAMSLVTAFSPDYTFWAASLASGDPDSLMGLHDFTTAFFLLAFVAMTVGINLGGDRGREIGSAGFALGGLCAYSAVAGTASHWPHFHQGLAGLMGLVLFVPSVLALIVAWSAKVRAKG